MRKHVGATASDLSSITVYKSVLAVRNSYQDTLRKLMSLPLPLQDAWLQCLFFGIAAEYTLLLDTLAVTMPKALLPPLAGSMLTGTLRAAILSVCRRIYLKKDGGGLLFSVNSCLKCVAASVKDAHLSSTAVAAVNHAGQQEPDSSLFVFGAFSSLLLC